MKKLSVLFIFLFSIFPKSYSTKTPHLSEQDYEQIFLQNPSFKEELEQQNPIFALACLGKTELQHYDINKLLRTNPVSKRTILHYLAIFDHHQLLNSLLQKYHSLKQKINAPDSYALTPLHYAIINSSIECIQLLKQNIQSSQECEPPYGDYKRDYPQNQIVYDHLQTHNYECYYTECNQSDPQSYFLPPIKNNLNQPDCQTYVLPSIKTILETVPISDVGQHMKNQHNSEIVKKRGSKYDQFFNPATQAYECPYNNCNKSYKQSHHLGQHMKNQHDNEIVHKYYSKYIPFYNSLTKEYVCPYNNCNKSYKQGSDLGQHMKNQHNSEIVKKRKHYVGKYKHFYNSLTKEYECPDCLKVFKYSNKLAKHMKTQHKSEIVKEGKKRGSKYDQFYNPATQTYECPYHDCNKSYKKGTDLDQHMKNQHKNEIVTKGKKCSSKYDQFYNPATQAYVCPDCGKTYTQRNNLANHMKNNHNSEIVQEGKKRGSKYDQFYNSLTKKYVCPDCGKKYTHSNALAKHMKNQHKSEMVQKKKKRGSKYNQFYNPLSQKYVCPDCRNYYLEGFVLGNHMKNKHNKIVNKKGTIKTIEIP